MDRLQQLFSFLEADPNDPFTLYAIATEYRARGEKEQALSFYEKVHTQHPDYVATYYHLAHLYIELENSEKAEAIFKEGIERCTQLKEAHALSELQNAYNNFLFDDLI